MVSSVCSDYYCCVTNYPKLCDVNNCCCFLLTDSVSQDFRQGMVGMFGLCSILSVASAKRTSALGVHRIGWHKMAKGWDHVKASSFICLVLRPRKLKAELWDCGLEHLHVIWCSDSLTSNIYFSWLLPFSWNLQFHFPNAY